MAYPNDKESIVRQQIGNQVRNSSGYAKRALKKARRRRCDLSSKFNEADQPRYETQTSSDSGCNSTQFVPVYNECGEEVLAKPHSEVDSDSDHSVKEGQDFQLM